MLDIEKIIEDYRCNLKLSKRYLLVSDYEFRMNCYKEAACYDLKKFIFEGFKRRTSIEDSIEQFRWMAIHLDDCASTYSRPIYEAMIIVSSDILEILETSI